MLESITCFLEKELKLTVNQKKTKVVAVTKMKFLGFTIGVDRNGAYPYPAKQAKERVRQSLKKLTKRNRGVALSEILEEIRQKMRGWLQYYGVGKLTKFVRKLDEWVRSRIRQYIWKQWKKIKTKITNLKRLGLSGNESYIAANTRKGTWRTAHSKTLYLTLTNKKLEGLGLINLSKTLQHIQSA